jgi:hypothetical protein
MIAPLAIQAPRITRSGLLVMALVPKLGCPLCWPALAALCGLLGVRFVVLDEAFLLMNVLGLLFAFKLILRQGSGAVAVVSVALLSASLSYRLGAGLAPSLCIGLVVAVITHVTRRLARSSVTPCCHTNTRTR